MGLILDSRVVIAAERRGDTVERLIERVVSLAGDQDAALSAVGLTELVHGLYRAQAPEMRVRRESFLHELLAFPAAKRDDQVDSVTQFLCWASDPWSEPGIETALPIYGGGDD